MADAAVVKNISELAVDVSAMNAEIAGVAAACDNGWILVSAYLVLFMQCGFAMLESGSVRSKNTKSILVKNLMDLGFGLIAWAVFGYGLAFGTVSYQGLFGLNGYFMSTVPDDPSFFIFQLAFACTAATIDSGSVAERMDLTAYFLSSFTICFFIYPFPCHWIWNGNGWLAALNYKDFAGSSVVHYVGGLSGVVYSVWLGPRLGRYNENGDAQEIPGHSVVLQALGTWILLIGWFGFNAGSTVQLTQGVYIDAANVSINTLLCALVSGSSSLLFGKAVTGRYDVAKAMNGVLGGLVAVTGPCAVMSALGSCILGVCSGIVYVCMSSIMQIVFKVDDPVDAFVVHGICGCFGQFMLGILDTADGLAYGWGPRQLIVQLLGLVTVTIWVCSWSLLVVGFMFYFYGDIRVTKEVEELGCDSELSGQAAYILTESKVSSAPHILETMLTDGDAVAILRKFLEAKKCPEVLEFYLEVQRFKRAEGAKRVTRVQDIYYRFLKKGASQEINVPDWTKRLVAIRRNQAGDHTFDECEQEAYMSMKMLIDLHFMDSAFFQRWSELIELRQGAPPLKFMNKLWCFRAGGKQMDVLEELEEKNILSGNATELNILLLGAGESGKSTFYKQLDIQLSNDTEMSHVNSTIDAIRVNSVSSIKRLIRMAESVLSYKFEGENAALRDRIMFECSTEEDSQYTKEDASDIAIMWKHDKIQEVFNNRQGFWLLESVEYYLDNCRRFCDDATEDGLPYSPTETDYLHVRIKTVGVEERYYRISLVDLLPRYKTDETLHDVNKLHTTWKIIDVGGQRSERRKWLQYFTEVDAVFFFVNLDGYHSKIAEDEKTLRMDESLTLIQSTFKKNYFKGVPIWIIFNKFDIFKSRFSSTDVRACFPDCSEADAATYDKALKFIMGKFSCEIKDAMLLYWNGYSVTSDFPDFANTGSGGGGGSGDSDSGNSEKSPLICTAMSCLDGVKVQALFDTTKRRLMNSAKKDQEIKDFVEKYKALTKKKYKKRGQKGKLAKEGSRKDALIVVTPKDGKK